MYPIQIPFLVQEKLDYYTWRNRLNDLNREYKQKISINLANNNHHEYLIYTSNNFQLNIRLIHNYFFSNNDRYVRKRTISGFIPMRHIYTRSLPKKYNFSSGLEATSAYKLSFNQRLDSTLWERYNHNHNHNSKNNSKKLQKNLTINQYPIEQNQNHEDNPFIIRHLITGSFIGIIMYGLYKITH